MQLQYITMGDLADQIPSGLNPVKLFYYKRLVAELSVHYPVVWRSWLLRRVPADRVLTQHVKVEEILLAFPMESMARVFGGDVAALGVYQLRVLHSLLLTWELGRALVVYPRLMYRDIHVNDDYRGWLVNPLTLRAANQETLCTNLHEYCGPGIVLRHGPWAAGPMHSVWDRLTLHEAVCGVSGLFHKCDLFPGF